MRTLLLAALHLTAGASARARGLPFVGRWDCAAAVLSFTDDMYDNGLEERRISRIERGDDGIYDGVFVDETTFVAVSEVTDSSIRWTAGDGSGVSTTCGRLMPEALPARP